MDPDKNMIFMVIHPFGNVNPLPHARTVSTAIHDGNDTKAAEATLLLMQVLVYLVKEHSLTS